MSKEEVENMGLRLDNVKSNMQKLFRHTEICKEENPDPEELKSLIKYFEEKELYRLCEMLNNKLNQKNK